MQTKILLLIAISCVVIILIYCFYQLFRNEEVYRIRNKWVEEDDDRWDKYSYYYMQNPNKSNWYGLRFPTEKNYK